MDGQSAFKNGPGLAGSEESPRSWYNQAMVGQRRKHPLPAGVVSARRPGEAEDAGSRIRAKAPEPYDESSHARSQPFEPPADRARRLVDALVGSEPHEIGPLVQQLLPLGNFALEEIADSFPGPLWRPSLATDSRLPRPDEISASAAALTAFGGEAIPYLARLMRDSSAETRYYATVICQAFTSEDLIGPLAQVALDEDRECRRVGLRLLSGYQHEPVYRNALAEIRRCAADLSQPLSLRRRAISALTQLRDDASAPLFVELLTDSDRGVATASRVGLRVLTAHDFGFSRDPWLRWLAERGRENRIQWLIEGLGDARRNIRLLASHELWQLTRFLRPSSETAGRDEFVAAQRHYQRWWAKNRAD